MTALVHYAGLWGGHIHSGPIYLHEIDEFVASCGAAGWESVAVADGRQPVGQRIVARWKRAA